jgi:NAD(P)-dependent dehydrogenase (short-subunit alcohol dehydrogenase family)
MQTIWDMNGKTCLITGATAGIGEVTACELARMGARVLLVGRDLQRCAGTVGRIREQTGSEAVETLCADLSSQAQVRRLAGEIQGRCDRLDVLVNNAGAIFMRRQESEEGVELTWALNHLSYFLLTNLLLDLLKASAPARIVNVSSDAHRGARLNFSDLEAQRGYSGFPVYARSKLANILFTFELARRLEGTGVTANALHPGFVGTRFAKNNGPLVALGLGLVYRFFALSPEQGARTSLYLAASPDVEGITGKYFVKSRPVRADRAAYDQEAANRLWQVSSEMVALTSAFSTPAGS